MEEPRRIQVNADCNDTVATPNPGGQEGFALDWDHRFVGMEGGWDSGKTFIGARKLMTLHIHNAFDDDGNPTNVKSAQISPTLTSSKDFAIPALEEAAEEFNMKMMVKSTSIHGDMTCVFTGSSDCFANILIRSAEKPERITGWTVGAIWGDECALWPDRPNNPKRDPWIQMMGRLRAHKASFLQGMYTYTNEGDHTRVYREFHAGDPDFALYTASTYENPSAIDFADKIKIPQSLRVQYIDGGALSMGGGKVYTEFDPRKNVDSAVVLVDALPLQVALDFNINPGMHLEVGQWNEKTGDFTVRHEIHGPRMDIRACANAFVRLMNAEYGGCKRFPGPVEVFGDATGAAGSAASVESCYVIFREILTLNEIPTRLRVPRSNPAVVNRINAFNMALLDITNTVHWRCHPSCERLREDMRQLSRKKNGEIDESDDRLKHASDAEGYRIDYLAPARIKTRKTGGRVSVTTSG